MLKNLKSMMQMSHNLRIGILPLPVFFSHNLRIQFCPLPVKKHQNLRMGLGFLPKDFYV